MYNHGKEHPEVSIVIATRNRRAMLADAVNSVQTQAGVDWELIVVDDASTDDTWDFLSGLHDPRIRCFRQEKQYERSAARNLGLANSRSEFIIFLDDDDLLWPRFYLAPGLRDWLPERVEGHRASRSWVM